MANNLQDDHQDHRNPSSSSSSSSSSDYSFEFVREISSDYFEENMMAHADDIIFQGKLLPINEQRKKPRQQISCRRSRSESRSDVNPLTAINSRSMDYKKLKRNLSMSSETDGSGKNSCSSRRHVLLYGLINVPQPEMNIRDLKNRQVRMTTLKTRSDSSVPVNVFSVGRNVDHKKGSCKMLELLSCKSSSVAVTAPLRCMAKV